MNYEKFKEQFDAYMATPQAQIDIDNMMERIRKEEIASKTERNIPLEFSSVQDNALEVLRDLYDEEVDEVLTFFQKERAEKNHKKELQEEEEKDIYDSRD